MLTRTTFGRYVYAIGGNEEATRLSGVAHPPAQDSDLRRVGSDQRDGRDHPHGAAQFGAADRRHDVRARRHRRHRDWRHQPDGRRRVACRNAGRRAYHGRAAQRPEPARCVLVSAADRDRRRHRRRRARGHDAQTASDPDPCETHIALLCAAAALLRRLVQPRSGLHQRQADGGAGPQDAEPPVLRGYAARRAGGGRPARRPAAGAGGRARDRRREADADRREHDPDRHQGALHHAQRLARNRLGAGQGEERQGADRGRRHARRRQGRRRRRRADRDLCRLRQLRGRKARRRVRREGHRRQSPRRHPRRHPRSRDRRFAAARLPRRRGRRARHHASSRRSPRTGSATRASTCSRTCCRRIPTSTRCSPRAT